jgi:hypothetical protein
MCLFRWFTRLQKSNVVRAVWSNAPCFTSAPSAKENRDIYWRLLELQLKAQGRMLLRPSARDSHCYAPGFDRAWGGREGSRSQREAAEPLFLFHFAAIPEVV